MPCGRSTASRVAAFPLSNRYKHRPRRFSPNRCGSSNCRSRTPTVMLPPPICASGASTPTCCRSASRRGYSTRPASKITPTACLSGAMGKGKPRAAVCAAAVHSSFGAISQAAEKSTHFTSRLPQRPTRWRSTKCR